MAGDMYAASSLVAALRWYREAAKRRNEGADSAWVDTAIRLAEDCMAEGYRRHCKPAAPPAVQAATCKLCEPNDADSVLPGPCTHQSQQPAVGQGGEPRMFPVHRDGRHPTSPKSVPWAFLAPHEEQAKRNHDQSLQRLAERGGLGEAEMVAVVEGKRWWEVRHLSDAEVATRLNELLAAWRAQQPHPSTGRETAGIGEGLLASTGRETK